MTKDEFVSIHASYYDLAREASSFNLEGLDYSHFKSEASGQSFD